MRGWVEPERMVPDGGHRATLSPSTICASATPGSGFFDARAIRATLRFVTGRTISTKGPRMKEFTTLSLRLLALGTLLALPLTGCENKSGEARNDAEDQLGAASTRIQSIAHQGAYPTPMTNAQTLSLSELAAQVRGGSKPDWMTDEQATQLTTLGDKDYHPLDDATLELGDLQQSLVSNENGGSLAEQKAAQAALRAEVSLALARPQAGLEKVQESSQGVAIEMVVDRSGSMGAEMEFDGRAMTRLDVVKRVFAEFVQGNGRDLQGRTSDLIGMITFAKFADTVCPLTLAHGALSGFLDTIHLVPEGHPENRTAIGDAIALAAARLQTAEETLARQTGGDATSYTIKSKVIILLTDGQNNTGRHTPEEASALAKQWGIKVYAVGVGGDDVVKIQTLLGTRMVRTGEGVDRETLTKLAETTGGVFRMAEDAEALRAVYQEIDRLEKSEVESIRYIDYKEYFAYLALAAFGLLALEAVLSCTLLRRLP